MGDMDDADSERCAAERRQLADGFKRLRTVFAALGDETRQQIFLALLEHETVGMRVPELTERTHLSRPAVSHHLKVLKDARLVDRYRVGTMNFYYVNAADSVWAEVKQLVDLATRGSFSAAARGFSQTIERKEQRL